MNDMPRDREREKMEKAVCLCDQRRKQWKKEGERSLWQNLSMIGALGWLIVTPTLLGILAGRWLDGFFESGIFFTGAFVFLGVSAGCALAWHRITKE